eukprot:3939423-Rhodomonas_salina.2
MLTQQSASNLSRSYRVAALSVQEKDVYCPFRLRAFAAARRTRGCRVRRQAHTWLGKSILWTARPAMRGSISEN